MISLQSQTVYGWYTHPAGKLLWAHELRYLQRRLQQCVGEQGLQIGGATDLSAFLPTPGVQRWSCLQLPKHPFQFQSCILTDLQNLPIFEASCNVVVVPHVLEYMPDPTLLIKELYRILAPGGKFILTGFNPCSLWGMVHKFYSARSPLYQGTYQAPLKILKLLGKNGFHSLRHQFVGYRPPVRNEAVYQSLKFLDIFGKMSFPSCANVYFIFGEKQMVGVTPILDPTVAWQKPYAVPNGTVINPTPTVRTEG